MAVSQPQIPAPHTQALRLELIQKRPNQRGVHRLEAQSRGRHVQPLVRKFQQQAERVAIGRYGVGTRLSLLQQALREEPFQERRQRGVAGHGRSSQRCSTRRITSRISSGQALRYQ